ncbi:MAG: acyl carrier protein [bacterium]|nr:acyl carrier protein [bacterium]
MVHDKLRDFIIREIIHDPGYPLQNDEALISGGLIDSFSLVQVQLFVEQEFGIRLPDTELTTEKIDTINDLAALIEASR